jgi:ABC-type siderophore export system fused ATPase/permease subunit
MFKLNRSGKVVVLTALVAVFSSAAGSAMADTTWQKNHPRREQVNNRLHNQNQRIKNEVKEGEISKAQAKNLHKEDHAIRQEERDLAKQNGGHITKPEQAVLNQQENGVSKQIGK